KTHAEPDELPAGPRLPLAVAGRVQHRDSDGDGDADQEDQRPTHQPELAPDRKVHAVCGGKGAHRGHLQLARASSRAILSPLPRRCSIFCASSNRSRTMGAATALPPPPCSTTTAAA